VGTDVAGKEGTRVGHSWRAVAFQPVGGEDAVNMDRICSLSVSDFRVLDVCFHVIILSTDWCDPFNGCIVLSQSKKFNWICNMPASSNSKGLCTAMTSHLQALNASNSSKMHFWDKMYALHYAFSEFCHSWNSYYYDENIPKSVRVQPL